MTQNNSKSPVVSAETDISGKKPRASSKVSYDQILSHSSLLSLEERVELLKELKRCIEAEVKQIQDKADRAAEITKGI